MKAILAFIATAYGLSVALSLVIGLTGGHDSPLIALGWLSMFLPAVSVVVVYLAMGEAPRVQWDHFPLRYLPIALFLIPAVLHVVMLPLMFVLQGGTHWQEWMTPGPDGLYHTPASLGWGVLTIEGLAGRIILNAVVGLLFVSFVAAFEEVGWRAWLLPRLRDRMGARPAVVLTAAIWALWHAPFQLSGILHIDGVSPTRAALVLPLGTMAAGLILGWLWLRTESLWLCAIAHGSLNDWGQLAFKYITDSHTPDRDLVVLVAGSLELVLAGILLLWRGIPTVETAGAAESR